MNMPITSRRRYHFLLGRYNDREVAAAQKKPLPPIEVEDQASELNQMAEKIRGSSGGGKLSESSLPASVRAALKQIEEAEAAKPKKISKEDKDKAKKKMVIKRKEDALSENITDLNKDSNISEKTKEKPSNTGLEVKENTENKTENKKETEKIEKENSPKTLQEASNKLKTKYSKIGIPDELKALLGKKKV